MNKLELALETLKDIAKLDKELNDGEAEYWTWGNYDDVYYHGICRGESIAAQKAREVLDKIKQ